MNKLHQIFSQTIAPTAGYGNDAKKAKEKDSDPMLEAYLPSDSVQLSSNSSQSAPSFNPNAYRFNNAMNSGQFNSNQFNNLPSLSKSYSSHVGGLLDLKG